MGVEVSTRTLEDVEKRDKEGYNSNNHWALEGRERPRDYEEASERCHTREWVALFHPLGSWFELEIEQSDVYWLREARLGIKRAGCPLCTKRRLRTQLNAIPLPS